MPKISLKSAESILFKKNLIEDLSKFQDSELPNVKILDFSGNKIFRFPRVSFENLLILNLMGNKLETMKGLADSTLPEL